MLPRELIELFFKSWVLIELQKVTKSSKLGSVDNVPSHHSGAQGRDVAGCRRSGAAAKAQAEWLCSWLRTGLSCPWGAVGCWIMLARLLGCGTAGGGPWRFFKKNAAANADPWRLVWSRYDRNPQLGNQSRTVLIYAPIRLKCRYLLFVPRSVRVLHMQPYAGKLHNTSVCVPVYRILGLC